MNRTVFLGYPVDNLSIEEALVWLKESIKGSGTRTVAVANANKLWQANHDAVLSGFLRSADLVIPEYAIVWGAKRIGISLTHVGGIMLLKAFLPFAEKENIRPYFLGAKPDVVERMVSRIKLNYPRLPICGFHHGYLVDGRVKKDVIKKVEEAKPDVLFVAMGSPKQEYLMAEMKEALTIPVLMGVGGSFDVLSGDKEDAPSWARSRGLEWIYRLSQDPLNPSYWQRYLVTNTWFLCQVGKYEFGRRSKVERRIIR